MYSVIGCSDCESVKIVEGNPETTVCNRCQAQIKVATARVIFESGDLQEAKEARSLAMAKRNGFDYLADEMVDREILNETVTQNVAEEELISEKADEDPMEIEEAGDIDKPKTAEERDPKKRIVMDAIEFLEEPTDDDVVEFAEDRGVEPDRAAEIVDKLCMEGEAMRTREGVVRLL